MSIACLLRASMPACLLLASASADVIGQFTFDNKSSLENALRSSSPAAGVILSGLGFNATTPLDFAGLNNVPGTDNDGYGFGNSPGSMFFHRAETGNPSAWGAGVDTAAATAPLNFTVAADATHEVTVTGVTFAVGNGTATIYNFQRAGDPRGAAVTSSTGGTVDLAAPVVIPAGTAATFTVTLNSGNYNSGHVFDSIALEGGVTSLTVEPLGQFTFNNKPNLAAALQPSAVAAGAILSSLAFNTTTPLDFAGLNNVPATDNDGYGFGGNSGETVMFFHRAVSGLPSAWGAGVDTLAATAPLNFTVAADATHAVTVTSVTLAAVGTNASTILYFQQAGAATGPSITSGGGATTTTASLAAPVVIPAGTSKTFTVKLNSGAFDSAHIFNTISVGGSVAALPTTPLGSYTFNDTSSLATALQPSAVVNGATLSNLGFNTSTPLDFAGLNNIPDTVNDGYGFGDNGGLASLFFHRAESGNPSAWGAGVNTSAATAPWNFTVSADPTHEVTVTSISVATGNNPATIYYFQEAGAATGPAITGGALTTTSTSLATPVVVAPGTSKTFTVKLNSGNFNSGHVFDSVTVNGSVSGGGGGGYTDWADQHAGGGEPEEDYDDDGTENGIEYFMGETGSGFTARPVPVGRTVTWPRDPAATVASFKVQTSETLAADSWTDVVPPDPNLDLSNQNEVRYTLPEGAARKFARLVVTP